jgi:hypothetical protein
MGKEFWERKNREGQSNEEIFEKGEWWPLHMLHIQLSDHNTVQKLKRYLFKNTCWFKEIFEQRLVGSLEQVTLFLIMCFYDAGQKVETDSFVQVDHTQ